MPTNMHNQANGRVRERASDQSIDEPIDRPTDQAEKRRWIKKINTTEI